MGASLCTLACGRPAPAAVPRGFILLQPGDYPVLLIGADIDATPALAMLRRAD
jgi:hypothetical protein